VVTSDIITIKNLGEMVKEMNDLQTIITTISQKLINLTTSNLELNKLTQDILKSFVTAPPDFNINLKQQDPATLLRVKQE
jgi:predicted RNase H-like nuclease (RuvC/YqgF family)